MVASVSPEIHFVCLPTLTATSVILLLATVLWLSHFCGFFRCRRGTAEGVSVCRWLVSAAQLAAGTARALTELTGQQAATLGTAGERHASSSLGNLLGQPSEMQLRRRRRIITTELVSVGTKLWLCGFKQIHPIVSVTLWFPTIRSNLPWLG